MLCFHAAQTGKHLLRTQKFVSATNVSRVGKRGNICVGNNVSATMCPRLPGPLALYANHCRARGNDNLRARVARVAKIIVEVSEIFLFFVACRYK